MKESKVESIDFIPTKEEGKVFKAKCFKCKEKEKMKTDNDIEFELPFKYINIPKDKNLIKECKNFIKESKEKYNDEKVIKRALYNYCPNCGHTVNVCCKDYVDFYSTKKKENKNEKENLE